MREFNGTFTFYQIQTKYKNKEWIFANLDHFGHPAKNSQYADPEKKNKYSFNASGECWQKTGFHGVFNSNNALNGLKQLSKKYKDQKFRLIKRTITQNIEPVVFIIKGEL